MNRRVVRVRDGKSLPCEEYMMDGVGGLVQACHPKRPDLRVASFSPTLCELEGQDDDIRVWRHLQIYRPSIFVHHQYSDLVSVPSSSQWHDIQPRESTSAKW